MKKILFLVFLMIEAIGFSVNCNWYTGNTESASKMVELVKNTKLTDKIYCDVEKYMKQRIKIMIVLWK